MKNPVCGPEVRDAEFEGERGPHRAVCHRRTFVTHRAQELGREKDEGDGDTRCRKHSARIRAALVNGPEKYEK